MNGPEGFFFHCFVQFLIAPWLATKYSEDKGRPVPEMRTPGAWIAANAVVGIVSFMIHPALTLLILSFLTPFSIAVWSNSRPENIRANAQKAAEKKDADRQKLLQLEVDAAQAKERERVRLVQEAAEAAIRESEAKFASVTQPEYGSKSPNEISETAKKIAEQLRAR